MGTIDRKDIIDRINGIEPNPEAGIAEPPVIRIIEYTNAWGKRVWGVVLKSDRDPYRYERETEHVQNPKLIWTPAER